MRKLWLASLAVLAFGVIQIAQAAELKLGVVDVRLILQKSSQMNALNAEIEKQFKPREQKIVDANKALNAEMEKINRDGAVMKENERSALQSKIISDKANLQGMMAAFQQDLTNAQNEALKKFLDKLSNIINKMAKEQKYDLIAARDSVLFLDEKLDITSQVMQALDKADK